MKEYTLSEWLSEWFEVYKKPRLKAASIVPIETALRLHVPESLKSVPLSALRVLDLDRAVNALPPGRTQKLLHDVLKASLFKAYRLELIPKDISKLLDPVRYKMKQGRSLSPEELTVFLRKIRGHKLESLFRFYLLTGCRRHEALTFTEHNIDWEQRVIMIHGTKTAGSDRVLPMSADLETFLRGLPRTDGPLFPFRDDYVTKSFKRLCPAHKLHDLRHTFATICAESNVHPTATQKMLGHSSTDMTLRVYTHVASSFVANEAHKINFSFLANKKGR